MNNDLPIAEIKALAEDVRLIKDFAENHNFDASLLKANISPSRKPLGDFPLLCMVSFIFLLILSLTAIKFWEPPLSATAKSYIFVIGLILVTFSAMSIHIKFKDKIITGIATVGLLLVLFIGAEIYTPEQAVDKAGELAK